MESSIRRRWRLRLLAINASVVGILLAALFQPVWQKGIRCGAEFSLALVAYVLGELAATGVAGGAVVRWGGPV